MLSSRGMDPASKFHVGTSGYSFPDWVGVFYPPGTRRQEMFAYYMRQFRTVELNYTFYRLPAARTLELLAQASPPHATSPQSAARCASSYESSFPTF